VASSGVASLLLPEGRTTHSRFKIPCDLDDTSTCNIKRGTMLAKLIKSTSLIIWGEAFMTHRSAFEALDRSLRDLFASDSQVAEETCFGDKVVVLGGDPRQILHVVENGTHPQIIDAAITSSPLWASVSILHLTQNMRLYSDDLSLDNKIEITSFSKWILDIGEDKIPARSKEGETERWWIKIPQDMLLIAEKDNLSCVVEAAYPNLEEKKYADTEYLKERAILTPTNKIVDTINNYIVSIIHADAKEYLSCDKNSQNSRCS
jgi:hypothetical protein